MAGDGDGGGAAKADEDEKPGRSCGEYVLDFGACVFRGGVQTGSAIAWGTRYTCYPVKERVVGCVDRNRQHMNPYLKKEVGTQLVPTFNVGAAGSHDP